MSQIIAALLVTVPVFVLMGLGRWLRSKGWMSADAQGFITKLVYWTSLPALILLGIARQDFSELQRWSVIVSTIGATLIGGFMVWAVCALLRIRRSLRGPLAAAAFWANVSYMGFPLADGAWGAEGTSLAGIVNAFTMPLFVVFGTVLLALNRERSEDDDAGIGGHLRVAVLNPIVMSAVAGLLVSFVLTQLGWRVDATSGSWQSEPPAVVVTLGSLAERLLAMLGTMGLPLALLAVGASIDPSKLKGSWLPLSVAALIKLVVTPLVTLLIIWLCFPQATGPERGVAVLLMGTPVAVGCFVIASQLRLGGEFLAALLVLTTLLSAVSLSIWLVILL